MDLLKRIKQLQDERNWSNYRLCDEAQIPYATLSNMYSRKTNPTYTTLIALCEAFDMSLSQFFNEDETAFILSDDEKNLITQYRKLDKKNKNAVYTLINELNN
ncbi:MAG: helix-turn-helix transcriptional regulator [Candidatus Borkfalkiaceae bacterium]|nr:helix-turn-helix transcriptional regulator [Christensenellaceae bacterium]